VFLFKLYFLGKEGGVNMKKLILSLVLLGCLLSPNTLIFADRGCSGFAGGLAGGMIGGVISGAMTRDSGSSKAQQDVEQLRREQQQEKFSGLQDQIEQQHRKQVTTLLIIALIILSLAVIFLGFMVVRKRGKGNE